MKRGITVVRKYDHNDIPCIVIKKKRRKLSLDEIQDILRFEDYQQWNGQYVLFLNCSEATLGGNGCWDLLDEPPGDKIDDDHIADIIQGRPTILPQEVRDVIFAKVRSYACDILDKLRELQVDLRANPAIFIGGGSILFRSFVEESPLVAHADFVTDPKANAIGYGMLATAQLRRMAPQNYGGEFFAQG